MGQINNPAADAFRLPCRCAAAGALRQRRQEARRDGCRAAKDAFSAPLPDALTLRAAAV